MRIALVFDAHRPDTWGIYYQRALAQFPVATEHCWYRDLADLHSPFDLYLRVDHGSYESPWPNALQPSAFILSETHLAKPFRAILREAARYTWLFCGHGPADAGQRRTRSGHPGLPAGRRNSPQGSGGRYWTRTSDPQLVELVL